MTCSIGSNGKSTEFEPGWKGVQVLADKFSSCVATVNLLELSTRFTNVYNGNNNTSQNCSER